MQKGDQIYIKGPRHTFAGGYAGEIGEIMSICQDVYPDAPPAERDLVLVAFDADLPERNSHAKRLVNSAGDFYRLHRRHEGDWPGDNRVAILFYWSELEPLVSSDSPVVG